MVACSGIASRRSFFQNILFEIGRPYRDLDDGELRLSLVDYLTSSEAPNDGTVLVFDDAHELPTEQFEDLSMLSGLMKGNAHCVHLILSGTVRLEELLSTPKFESLNQRIAARSYLEPFRVHETEAYVRRQFDRADAMADEIFVDGAVTAIHKCTGGTPRLINQLCDHALVLGAAGGHTKLNELGVREAWSDLQHLPPPEDVRQRTSVEGEDIVEFGSLDDDIEISPPTTDQTDAATMSVGGADFEVGRNESTNRDENEPQQASNPPVIAPSVESAPFEGPVSDGPVTDGPVTDGPVTDGPVLQASATPSAETDSRSHDTDDPLEENEDGLDDFKSLPYPATDPFAEVFENEEVVVKRPSSMLNRLADRQPEVISQFGQDMISTLEQLTTVDGFLPAMEHRPEGQELLLGVDQSDEGFDADDTRSTSADGIDSISICEGQEDLGCQREPQEPLADAVNGDQPSQTSRVVDYSESGSYEIMVDFDSTDAGARGAVEFQAAIDEVEASSIEYSLREASEELLENLDGVRPDSVRQTNPDGERLTMEKVVKMTMSTPTVRATSVADKVELMELPPRETQEAIPEVRVVELTSSDSESTKPRRRFKQLFSGLTER